GRFFDGLIEDYAHHKPDVLIVNVLRYRDAMDVDHLTFDDVVRILDGVRPKVAVLSHFGTKMLERNPDELAEQLENDSGRRVIAARDGYRFDADIEVAAAAS
ncbi:MAG: hypothetical protein JO233_00625, partial [Candidatus Eremiobacteraeota bacterium]|nr:hypothetical protein [Candidatus Eremiobacteraeota bacterium]